ncbi:hypothetical protein GCM10009839_14250 [Catenulispora yoronensis]|uniref:Uncharacterized protein n=1 Tax=Catenulispora yoronensis TaxID=450799 RepID=A0ABN2TTY5_9ACTN
MNLDHVTENACGWLALLLVFGWGDWEDWSARRWAVTVLVALCLGVAS